MKLALILMVSFLGSFAQAHSLRCESACKKYVALVEFGEATTGQVLIDGEKHEFGDLECTVAPERTDCSSLNVADAGFHLVIENIEGTPPATLTEYWIGGERPLADLVCTVQ